MNKLIFLTCISILLSACDKEPAKPIDLNKPILRKAEEVIDAFYTFDRIWLERLIISAKGSVPAITFYQGWAEGGNYRIIVRSPCIIKSVNVIRCSITVEDDLMKALQIDYHVTDTFTFTFSKLKITKIDTSSNDLEVFWHARKWVETYHPNLIEISCKGMWEDGITPEDCVKDMITGYKLFRESEAFPDEEVIADMISTNGLSK